MRTVQGERLSAKGAHYRKQKKKHCDFAYTGSTMTLFTVIFFYAHQIADHTFTRDDRTLDRRIK